MRCYIVFKIWQFSSEAVMDIAMSFPKCLIRFLKNIFFNATLDGSFWFLKHKLHGRRLKVFPLLVLVFPKLIENNESWWTVHEGTPMKLGVNCLILPPLPLPHPPIYLQSFPDFWSNSLYRKLTITPETNTIPTLQWHLRFNITRQ